MNLTVNGIDARPQIALFRECSAPEITRSTIIPFDAYVYKYGALGGDYDFRQNCVTLRETESQRVIGFCGASPVRIQYNFVESLSFWTVDLFVIPEYQGQGLATVLYDNVERDKPLLMALGTSDRAFPIKLKRGWLASESIREYYFRRRSSSLKQFLRQAFCNCKRMLFKPAVDDTLDYELTRAPLPEKIDALWQLAKKHYPSIAIRDARYVNWRYLSSPARCNYRFLLAKTREEGEYQAVLVLGIRDDRIKIVDYIGPADNPLVKARLIQEMFLQFPAVALYQCIASCAELQSALHNAGFYQYPVNPRFTVLNNTGDQASANAWFVMLGDSDGEHIEAMHDVYKKTAIVQ